MGLSPWCSKGLLAKNHLQTEDLTERSVCTWFYENHTTAKQNKCNEKYVMRNKNENTPYNKT